MPKVYERYAKYFILTVFGIFTLFLCLSRVPFWDEANAWLLAKSFTFPELFFTVLRREGHLFLWFLVQMPFAKADFYYPYPIYILNWLFSFIAILILWYKSPFKFHEKALITFSYPFFWYFAQVARCYSIGIMLLFIILALWKKRTQRPYLISALLFLLSNTSVMAIAASVPLFLILLFDLYKEKNKFYKTFLISFLTGLVVLIQVFGSKLTYPMGRFAFLNRLIEYFFIFETGMYTNLTSIIEKLTSNVVFLIYFLSIPFFFKAKRPLFFFISTNLIILYVLIFKYAGSYWHCYFFYIYLIASIWLYRLENREKTKLTKIFNGTFTVLIALMALQSCFCSNILKDTVYNSRAKITADTVINSKLTENAKVYTFDAFSDTSIGMLPFFKGTKFHDMEGKVRYTMDGFNSHLYWYKDIEDPDKLVETFDKDKKNILIVSTFENRNFYLGKKYRIDLIKRYISPAGDIRIYEMKASKI